ncbi:unnamed protein product, partial [Mesorhabditis belari]|uniref:RanBP2-type domain-containing protein n=1 Tax=Mesorhabditis belari TaxID=2138241 RepID=A0AAF3F157_9BILA
MTGKKKKEIEQEEEEDVECTWECTVCTYRNKGEAFKCDMCDTRKGTSTRKPRLNENVVAMQQVVQNFAIHQSFIHPKTPKRAKNSHADSPTPSSSRLSPESISSGPNSRPTSSQKGSTRRSDEKTRRRSVPLPDNLIFRSSPQKKEVNVNGVKATIAEFRPRPAAKERIHAILNDLRKDDSQRLKETKISPVKMEIKQETNSQTEETQSLTSNGQECKENLKIETPIEAETPSVPAS